MKRLRHFDTALDVLHYIETEFVATLEDDALTSQLDGDRVLARELSAKAADVVTVMNRVLERWK